jgi:hypothetical protein
MIDPQRDVIDDRKRSKPLGQATQFNGRQSHHSLKAPLSAAYLSLDQYKHECEGAGKASKVLDGPRMTHWRDVSAVTVSPSPLVGEGWGEGFRSIGSL